MIRLRSKMTHKNITNIIRKFFCKSQITPFCKLSCQVPSFTNCCNNTLPYWICFTSPKRSDPSPGGIKWHFDPKRVESLTGGPNWPRISRFWHLMRFRQWWWGCDDFVLYCASYAGRAWWSPWSINDPGSSRAVIFRDHQLATERSFRGIFQNLPKSLNFENWQLAMTLFVCLSWHF